MDSVVPVVVIVALLLLNALFVAAEFAIVGAPRTVIERRAQQGRRAAKLVLQTLEQPKRQDRFIATAHARFQESGDDMPAFAAKLVDSMAASRQRLPGLGHPVFKKTDPRAAILRRVAAEEGLWNEPARLYEEIHRAFTSRPGKADIPINDVGVMAAVLVALGFTPEETTGLAVISTLPGVVAHISEELSGGTPIRIVPDATVAYDVAEGKDFKTDWEEAGWPPGA